MHEREFTFDYYKNDSTIFVSPSACDYMDLHNNTDDGNYSCVTSAACRDSAATSVLLTCLRAVLLSSVLSGLLLLLSWALWWLYYVSFRSPASQLPLPPGSMGLPLIGETLTFLLLGASFYKSRLQLYGKVFKTHLLGCPIVRVVGADNVRKVLLGENTLVTSYWPASVRMMMGSNAVSTSSGEFHRALRKGVAKAFDREALSGYAPIMQQIIRDYLTSWCDAVHIQGYQQCRSLTFAIACRALTGLKQVRQTDQEYLLNIFETYMDNLFCLPFHLPGCGLSKGMRARNALLKKIEECMREKQSQPEMGKDALSLLMRLGGDDPELTNEELKNTCLELLFAGHATLSSASTSLLLLLAKNPAVIKRIQEELEEHGIRGADPDDLTFDTVSRLTYVGHVVKEVLRLAPPIGAGFRRVIRTFELGGYQVPEGWNVAYSIRETQMFSDLFTDRERFDPDRWANLHNDHDETFNFLPFGRGPRSCVGKEYARLFLRILTVELARSCSWTLMNEDAQIRLLPVPHPVDGLPMHITFQQQD